MKRQSIMLEIARVESRNHPTLLVSDCSHHDCWITSPRAWLSVGCKAHARRAAVPLHILFPYCLPHKANCPHIWNHPAESSCLI